MKISIRCNSIEEIEFTLKFLDVFKIKQEGDMLEDYKECFDAGNDYLNVSFDAVEMDNGPSEKYEYHCYEALFKLSDWIFSPLIDLEEKTNLKEEAENKLLFKL